MAMLTQMMEGVMPSLPDMVQVRVQALRANTCVQTSKYAGFSTGRPTVGYVRVSCVGHPYSSSDAAGSGPAEAASQPS